MREGGGAPDQHSPPQKGKAKAITDGVALGLVALALAYILILALPAPAFPYQLETGAVALYSRTPIDSAAAAAVAADMHSRLESAGLGTSVRPVDVYLTRTRRQFAFFANRSHKSFAVSYVALGTTYVAPSDLPSNSVPSQREEHVERTLSGVIAHEATHHILRKRLGFLRAHFLPEWKKEGICEYVAAESTFDEEEGIALLKEGRSDPSRAYAYFRARMLVTHLIEDQGMTIEEVLSSDVDAEAVERSLRQRLQG